MEQQTPIPPPPQIKNEGARRAKTRHFPILDLGGGRGGPRFSSYFVQDCSSAEFCYPILELTPQIPPILELLFP